MSIFIDAKCALQIQNVDIEKISNVMRQTISERQSGSLSIDKKKKLIFAKDLDNNTELKEIDGVPFTIVDDGILKKMGVPGELINLVKQNVSELEDINNLPINTKVKEKLEYWLINNHKKMVSSIVNIQYVAENEEHLMKFYRKDITKLLLHLHPDQEELVSKQIRKSPIIVKGSAGSGKTTIALYRMRKFAKEGQDTIYITYNKSLKRAAETLMYDLEGEIPPGIQISTLHSWCHNFIKRTTKGRRIHICEQKESDIYLSQAIDNVQSWKTSRLFARDLSFWRDEIDNIIKGRAEADKQQYLSIERVGTGFPLDEVARKVVWAVYKEYEELKENRFDYTDLPLESLRLINQGNTPEKYDHLFIDEAQDLSKVEIKVALNLCKNPGGIFVVADAAQSIYQQGFKWKDLGITIASQNVFELRRNHRNTNEILSAAQSLIENVSELADSEDILKPEMSTRNGLKPFFIGFNSNLSEQIGWTVSDIKRRLQNGECLPKNIAVLAREKYYARKICSELEKNDINSSFYKNNMDLSHDAVKCITMHSSKGLEFPLVYLIGIDKNRIPKRLAGLNEDEIKLHKLKERKLLYVAMTRAMNELIVTFNIFKHSEFTDNINKDFIIRIRGGDSYAFNEKGVSLFDIDNYKDALQCFEKALEIDNKNPEYLINKGVLLYNSEDYEGALPCFEKALEINNKNPEYLINKGDSLRHLNRDKEAILCYNKALELDDKNAYVFNVKGVLLYNSEDYEGALPCFEKALEINNKNPEYLINKNDTLREIDSQ